MRIGVAFDYLRSRLWAFAGEQRGNVMITFALSLVPIVGLTGAAVDYSRGNSAKVAMQSAVDATALILSKEAQGLTTAQLNSKATAIFTAQFNRPDVTNLAVVPHLVDMGTGSYKLTVAATATVPTTFTKILGQEQMNLGVSNEIVWGIKKLELVLALDVTGSMASNNKMTELKKAAKSLLTTLKAAAKKDGDIKVAIVPFAVVVNAGAANVGAASLDWSDWSSPPAVMTTWPQQNAAQKNAWDRAGAGARCPFTANSPVTSPGFQCTNGPASKTNEAILNPPTIPTSGTYAGLICPSKDTGTQTPPATGLVNNRYYSGCYYNPPNSVKPESAWHPVARGSSASCGSLPSSQCQCSDSGSNKVCAMIPESPNWTALASTSCGSLPSSAFSVSGGFCKQKTYDTSLRVWRPSPKTAWDGCVRDRNQSYDVENTAPSMAPGVQKTNINGVLEDYPSAATPLTSDSFQPFQYSTCPTALMPLSFNWSALETKIDELQPAGNTNVTIGLSWAHHALTASNPLNNAAAPSDGLKKVIILLTDGDNTQNRWTNTQSDIDARTQQACANVKANDNNIKKIEIWTIRVINGNASLLQACATKPSMYKNVQDAAQLNTVFADIARSLTDLRIAK